ncbi:MAG: ester cyclase [Pseudomonadota bacterium]
MKGFDPKFRDLPDYILGITKEIWEDRNIQSILDYYGADGPVRSPASLVVGNGNVIAATLATLAEFPDRTLLGEDVIWSGDDESGYLSSHRIISAATHLGDGVYGPATGKKLRYRIIADCACRNNQVFDEWLIRDQGAVVRQLGIDPKQYAADRIAAEGGPESATPAFTPAMDVDGGYQGRGNDNPHGQTYADILTGIVSADLAVIERSYDRACQLELPGSVTGHGREAADRFWLGLRASFPSAKFDIHHQIGRDDPMMPPRAALRWSLHGRHDGWGSFGPPTGAEVYVMGISHAEFGPWGLRREWIAIDETAIWKQILMHTG